MRNDSHSIREEIRGVLLFVAAIWVAYLATLAFPALDRFGIVPRTLLGLVGIPAAPFLHEGLLHLLGNTIPLLVLLALLAGSKARSWEIVIDVILLGGLLLWIFGRTAIHIGASGLVFGLAAFLVFSGVFERRIVPLAIAGIVCVLFGGTLLWGIMPRFGSQISWDGHLCSAVAGGILAYVLTKGPPSEATAAKEPAAAKSE